MEINNLPSHFVDLLKSFNSHGVKYLVIGGWAVMAYGHHRLTEDFDVWVEVTRENAERVRAALLDFIGVAPTVEEVLKADKFFRMGVVPNRAEVLTDIEGVTFEHCYAEREPAKFGGVDAPLISIEHLIQNKLAAGRPKDISDAAYLRQIRDRKKRP